jgi:hypothetical protein
MRVHWVAVPKALRARRVNRRSGGALARARVRVCGGAGRASHLISEAQSSVPSSAQ